MSKTISADQPLKKKQRISEDGKLRQSMSRRMEERISFLENELAEAKDWIAELYEKLKAYKQQKGQA